MESESSRELEGRTMKVGVRSDRCQGHARCEAVSAFFTLDEDGYSNIGAAKEAPVGSEAEVRFGVESWPPGGRPSGEE